MTQPATPGRAGNIEWPVLPECTSTRHNTHNSLKGKYGCICPHAQDLRKQRATRHRADREKTRRKIQTYKALQATMPPLTEGACSGQHELFDAAMDDHDTHAAISARETAKLVCETCPALQECRRYVQREESPRGSWMGVWGGMDANDRRGVRVYRDRDGLIVRKEVS